MDQYIGKLLDNRYEIIERIGTGGMAVVYKGRDHRLNRLVAVKILKEELAQDAEFRRRFHDESQAVAMLSREIGNSASINPAEGEERRQEGGGASDAGLRSRRACPLCF